MPWGPCENTKSAANYRRDLELGALLTGDPSPNPNGAFTLDELMTFNPNPHTRIKD